MLNTFPDLLAFGLFAPLILRLAAGVTCALMGWRLIRRDKESWVRVAESLGRVPGLSYVWVVGGLLELGGILLILGLYTQVAALLLATLTGILSALKRKRTEQIPYDRAFLDLLLVVLISLLFSGAGFFAFDLPL